MKSLDDFMLLRIKGNLVLAAINEIAQGRKNNFSKTLWDSMVAFYNKHISLEDKPLTFNVVAELAQNFNEMENFFGRLAEDIRYDRRYHGFEHNLSDKLEQEILAIQSVENAKKEIDTQ